MSRTFDVLGKMVANEIDATEKAIAKNMERISTGNRINSAADDPAGLGISERMESQIKATDVAKKNAQDGISLVQTAEGALSGIGNVLHRLNEIVVQASNGVLDDSSRGALKEEFNQLLDHIDKVCQNTQYNTLSLFSNGNGDSKNIFNLQVGPNVGDSLTINIETLSSHLLGLRNIDLNSTEGATKGIDIVGKAIKNIASRRGYLGATQNRLEYCIDLADNYSKNMNDAHSRIKDVDIAAEVMDLAKNNVRREANMSLLVQIKKMGDKEVHFIRDMLRVPERRPFRR